MKRIVIPGALLLLICASAAQAQLYKWVGADGKVTYSDVPPPSSAARVETKPLTIGDVSAGDFPFELQTAMKNNPVTLYTTVNCAPCDDGRKLLAERGVPYAEKTVNSGEDAAQFRKIAGADAQLPYLVVGRHKERGYEPGAWNTALNSAGYPESSKLPKNYRNPTAEATAPAPKPVAAKQDNAVTERASARNSAGELPPPVGNVPPGFRF
jgi:glutaredoxin